MQTKGLIFDFDGVIGLSEHSRFKVIQKAFADVGILLPDIGFKRMVGIPAKEFLHDLELVGLTDEVRKSVLESYIKEYKSNILTHVKPNLPVVRFIKNYSGNVKFAIASGNDRMTIEKLLKIFGISQKFVIIVARDDIKNTKPNPEQYLMALEKLAITPKECIAIEDSIAGLQAAKSAGIKAYIVLNGTNSKEGFIEVSLDGFLQTEKDFHDLLS